MHYAVKSVQIPFIRLLQENGADMEMENSEGQTPLMKAILDQNDKAAAYLIGLGASLSDLAHWSSHFIFFGEFLHREKSPYIHDLVKQTHGLQKYHDLMNGIYLKLRPQSSSDETGEVFMRARSQLVAAMTVFPEIPD